MLCPSMCFISNTSEQESHKFGFGGLDWKLPDIFIIVFIKFHKNAPLLPTLNFQIYRTIILYAVYMSLELGLSH